MRVSEWNGKQLSYTLIGQSLKQIASLSAYPELCGVHTRNYADMFTHHRQEMSNAEFGFLAFLPME